MGVEMSVDEIVSTREDILARYPALRQRTETAEDSRPKGLRKLYLGLPAFAGRRGKVSYALVYGSSYRPAQR